MTSDVWSYSDSEDVANELVTAAGELANGLGGRPVAVEIGEPRDRVEAPARLLLKGDLSNGSSPEVASEALFRAAKSLQPGVVLIGATRNGREVSSRLAVKLGWGCLSDALKVLVRDKSVVVERGVYAGKVVAKVMCPTPAVVTVKPGSYGKSYRGHPDIESVFEVGQLSGTVKVVARKTKEAGAVDLKKARVIVSAGRGVKKKEDLPQLEELAKDMGGALGCSRPLSSDLGWLPEECHIGLTGVTVKPELYVAVGISGQLQHVAGMKDSKVVVAINTDAGAPIFQACDYGIVGDLYQVVPALRKALASRR